MSLTAVKKMLDKNNLRKCSFHLYLWLWYNTMGKSQRTGLEVAGHTTSSVRRQKGTNITFKFTISFLFNPESHPISTYLE